MRKQRNIIFYFFLLFLMFSPTNVNAFSGSYRYDINKVTVSSKNLLIHGWGVINDNSGKAIHNINPKYTLKLIGADSRNSKIATKEGYGNRGAKLRPYYSSATDYPRDYSKAFYTIPTTGTYANQMYPTTGRGERANMVQATGNRFYINTDFWFAVPIQDIKDLLNTNKVERVYFEMTIEVSKGSHTIFGKSFSVPSNAKRVINLSIQSNRVNTIANHPELKNLKFMDRAEKITVAAGGAFVQANRYAFLGPTSDRRVKYWSENSKWYFSRLESGLIDQGKERGKDYTMLYYGQGSNYKIVDDNIFMEDIYGSPDHVSTDLYGYYYYQVNTTMSQSSNTVSDGGEMTTYIPALWGVPEEGKITYIKEEKKLCTERDDCKANVIDSAGNTCPSQTPDCCSLCTNTATRVTYQNKTFCKSMDKCGTCATDPRCQITTNGVVPSTCPTGRDKCCSLCTDPDPQIKAKYANTEFCKNKCNNQPTCSNNPECVKAKLGSNSKCPVNKPSDPMSADCCKTICAKPENKNTDYCTKTCKKPTPTCLNNPECQSSKLGSNSKCPVNKPSDPMSGDCCKTICAKAENKGTDYCTKICNPTPPTPPVTCNTMTDPQEKYCCLNPGDSICKVYEAEDPDYDPSDSTSSEKKGGVCDPTNDSEIKFKYPAEGFGKITTTNTACKVSCQEELGILFKPIQSVRAGMGFKYPINTESTRYCTAEYSNQSWVDGLRAAALAAKNALNAMKDALKAAKERDTSCGTSTMLTASVPSCPSPYTDGRSGLTCRCSSCNTCWNSCPSTCGGEEYKCGTIEEPDKKCYTQTYPCFKLCNPYDCEGTTSISCPSQEGHQLSYVPDRCEKKICSGDRTDWGSAQSEISSYLNAAQSARNTYTAQISIINRYLNDRKTCDNYVSNNPYNGPKDAKIDIDIEEIDNQTKYIDQLISRLNDDSSFENARVKKSKNYTVYNNKKTESVSNPGLVGDHSARAAGFQGVYEDYSLSPNTLTYDDFWNKKSDAKYQFEFSNNYYVQKYTGELGLSNNSAYIYGGRFAYTDFYQQTGKYDLKLTAVELGPHLNNAGSNIWKIDPFKCEYNLTNLIFPPKGDTNYTKYGNVGFEFRQISLTEPFPNRTARENWLGKESLITNVEYGIYNNQPLYHFNLNSSNREKVRFYNSKNKYDSFNPADPYKSNFLKDHNIILR